jgi:hypothetical protein
MSDYNITILSGGCDWADFVNEINNIMTREVNEDKKCRGQDILINLNETKGNYSLTSIAEKSNYIFCMERIKTLK